MSRPSTTSRLSEEASASARIADRRAQIGVEREVLAQSQQPGLGTHVIGHAVPFRSADGAKQHRVGGFGARHVGLADRLAMGVVGAAADEALFDLERARPPRVEIAR